jgi:hypothetical protein
MIVQYSRLVDSIHTRNASAVHLQRASFGLVVVFLYQLQIKSENDLWYLLPGKYKVVFEKNGKTAETTLEIKTR